MGASVLTSPFLGDAGQGFPAQDNHHHVQALLRLWAFVYSCNHNSARRLDADLHLRRGGHSSRRQLFPLVRTLLLAVGFLSDHYNRSRERGPGETAPAVFCDSVFYQYFFNWVFIFGKLGAPRMEVAGAAVGTLISRTFEFLLYLRLFSFF